jgi:hypothetical protein
MPRTKFGARPTSLNDIAAPKLWLMSMAGPLRCSEACKAPRMRRDLWSEGRAPGRSVQRLPNRSRNSAIRRTGRPSGVGCPTNARLYERARRLTPAFGLAAGSASLEVSRLRGLQGRRQQPCSDSLRAVTAWRSKNVNAASGESQANQAIPDRVSSSESIISEPSNT